MRLSSEAMFTESVIQERVRELATQINHDYHGRKVTAIVVLKGALFFAADLVRHLDVELQVSFIRAKSYQKTESSGTISFNALPEGKLKDEHVLLIEDILDTGRTGAEILRWIESHHPASIAVCTFLDKPERRVTPITANYVGFSIPNTFVVGYGMDYEERYRQLPAIYTLSE